MLSKLLRFHILNSRFKYNTATFLPIDTKSSNSVVSDI